MVGLLLSHSCVAALAVALRCGRSFFHAVRLLVQGTLRGYDQATNLILDECHERVYSSKVGRWQAGIDCSARWTLANCAVQGLLSPCCRPNTAAACCRMEWSSSCLGSM